MERIELERIGQGVSSRLRGQPQLMGTIPKFFNSLFPGSMTPVAEKETLLERQMEQRYGKRNWGAGGRIKIGGIPATPNPTYGGYQRVSSKLVTPQASKPSYTTLKGYQEAPNPTITETSFGGGQSETPQEQQKSQEARDLRVRRGKRQKQSQGPSHSESTMEQASQRLQRESSVEPPVIQPMTTSVTEVTTENPAYKPYNQRLSEDPISTIMANEQPPKSKVQSYKNPLPKNVPIVHDPALGIETRVGPGHPVSAKEIFYEDCPEQAAERDQKSAAAFNTNPGNKKTNSVVNKFIGGAKYMFGFSNKTARSEAERHEMRILTAPPTESQQLEEESGATPVGQKVSGPPSRPAPDIPYDVKSDKTGMPYGTGQSRPTLRIRRHPNEGQLVRGRTPTPLGFYQKDAKVAYDVKTGDTHRVFVPKPPEPLPRTKFRPQVPPRRGVKRGRTLRLDDVYVNSPIKLEPESEILPTRRPMRETPVPSDDDPFQAVPKSPPASRTDHPLNVVFRDPESFTRPDPNESVNNPAAIEHRIHEDVIPPPGKRVKGPPSRPVPTPPGQPRLKMDTLIMTNDGEEQSNLERRLDYYKENPVRTNPEFPEEEHMETDLYNSTLNNTTTRTMYE